MTCGRRLVEPLGFFDELGWGYATGSVAPARGRSGLSADERAAVVRYLRTAPSIMSVMTIYSDPLDPANTPIAGSGTMRSDGVWGWLELLAHLLERHDVALPPAFVAHVRAAGFTPPGALAPGLPWMLPGMVLEDDAEPS